MVQGEALPRECACVGEGRGGDGFSVACFYFKMSCVPVFKVHSFCIIIGLDRSKLLLLAFLDKKLFCHNFISSTLSPMSLVRIYPDSISLDFLRIMLPDVKQVLNNTKIHRYLVLRGETRLRCVIHMFSMIHSLIVHLLFFAYATVYLLCAWVAKKIKWIFSLLLTLYLPPLPCSLFVSGTAGLRWGCSWSRCCCCTHRHSRSLTGVLLQERPIKCVVVLVV